MLGNARRRLRERREQVGLSRTSRRVVAERLTYLSPAKLRSLEESVAAVENAKVRGDFVEAGVALGGSGVVLASGMGRERQFHGYDVFATIPPPTEQDPPEVHERYRIIAEGRSKGIRGDTYYGYLDDLYERVLGAFARHGQPVDGRRVHLHRGLFDETLQPDRPVALAHIDCDWYEPVKLCIERLWPVLEPGGRMIFDDYNDYGGCKAAVDAFVARHAEASMLQSTPNAIVVRARDDSAA